MWYVVPMIALLLVAVGGVLYNLVKMLKGE